MKTKSSLNKLMNEQPYFYFVVFSEPKSWPYFAEIPYTAWPDEAMSYNSNGNCEHIFDRDWSYLDVMNWETHENLIVCNAQMFTEPSAQKTLQLIEQNMHDGDDLLANSHVARLFLYWLENLPAEFRIEGNVVIGSFRCITAQLSAAVSELFMKRLASDRVWDAQSSQVLVQEQTRILEKWYKRWYETANLCTETDQKGNTGDANWFAFQGSICAQAQSNCSGE